MIHTKIIATLGPASAHSETLDALIDAGVNVFRINFSHGSRESHQASIGLVRAAGRRKDAIVAIMGDLSGPKIRLGSVAGGPRLIAKGQSIRIVREASPRGADALGTSYPAIVDEVQVGHAVLIDDGNVRLRVSERTSDALVCLCEEGGVVSDHKGVNLPDTALSLPSMTEKDVADAAFAVEQELDYLALSFVRRPKDLTDLRKRLPKEGGPRIVAKIEKPEAIEHIVTIIEACDVLLVARGDLGVEMDVARVPMLQKQMVRQCRYAGRPVIIATQMLQSMVESAVPTRAEVSDVANAILDGADAVMLSAESAVGKHPVEAVRMLRRIAEETEPIMHRWQKHANMEVLAATMRVTSAVARGAALLARDLEAKVVAVFTKAGNTPGLLSKQRLDVPVIGVANNERACRRMAMFYGVTPLLMEHACDYAAMLTALDTALLERAMVRPGDMAIVVAGTELTHPGSTNSLLIHLVHEHPAGS